MMITRTSILKRGAVVVVVAGVLAVAACGGEEPWDDVNSQDQASATYGTPGLLDPDDVLYDSGESDEFQPELVGVAPQFVEAEICVQCKAYAQEHNLDWTEFCEDQCAGSGFCKPLLGGGLICNCGLARCPAGSGFISGAMWSTCELTSYEKCMAPTILSK
jgi:hypothetical protein